ncbi:hypothetical protein EX30DRAFT_399232 [Ascodesmis nigricans]|uniref:Uncharacterized protein n=1 Tax=Ascodesmis nigricans TaxID=341454 RepID=A0A4S2MHY7_9PEZI|nr:hypothetical protein EX30DRAFT_399232 [Ascodesmis nigricans]
MSLNGSNCQPAYVEDYDSVVSMAIPETRRGAARDRSGLSKSISANAIDEVSDSGYSSTTPPNQDSPPQQKSEPSPSPSSRRDPYRRGTTPSMGRPASKSISRATTPAAPRNIPNARPRERSTTVTSTDNADECDCSDCKKPATKASPSASSPSVPRGAWPHNHSPSYHGVYGQSPQWGQDFGYPLSYDGYDGVPGSSRNEKKRERSSSNLPPRPSSSFQGAMSSSYGSGFAHGYFPPSSPAPPPPGPSSTCPPPSNYMYAPPPPPQSPAYGTSPYPPPPLAIPPYGYHPDPYAAPPTPSSTYPSDYPHPPPNRRNSLRAPAPPPVFYDDHHPDYYPRPPQRRSTRLPSHSSQDRPLSWTPQQFDPTHHRSLSVPPPPQDAYAPPPSRKSATTPGPPRRRESAHNQERNAVYRPSALSRAMESCAIDDEPASPSRGGHSRSHSHPVHPAHLGHPGYSVYPVHPGYPGHQGYPPQHYMDPHPRRERERDQKALTMPPRREYTQEEEFEERRKMVKDSLRYGGSGAETMAYGSLRVPGGRRATVGVYGV